MYDIIVIGSGPSGLMASIFSAKNGNKVLLVEKNNSLGKKLLASGGGRCNITNLKEVKDLIPKYKNGEFLYNTLFNFSPKDIYNYFSNELGVELKEEIENRIYPKTNKSKTILDALEKELKKYNVDISLEEELKEILVEDNSIKGIKTNKRDIPSKKVILASGGKSYPSLGANDSGYKILAKIEHEITSLYPTETPLVSNDKFILEKILQGISLDKVSVSINGIKEKREGSFIFTHFGVSGSAPLRISESIYFLLKNKKIPILQVDFLPNTDNKEILNIINDNPLFLKNYIPKRLLDFILESNNINIEKGLDLSKKQKELLTLSIKSFKINISDIRGFKNAFVTGGGLSLDEVNPKTFQSKKVNNLYIVGEILDIHGQTGGYNITSCLSMGYSVGVSI